MNTRTDANEPADSLRIGPAGSLIGVSPRMIRYLEAQGVIATERGPGPRGHRHFPPPELHLGRAAALAMEDGQSTATLRALRSLADGRVRDVRTAGDPLAWFELLALARAVEVARRDDELAPSPTPGPGPADREPSRRRPKP